MEGWRGGGLEGKDGGWKLNGCSGWKVEGWRMEGWEMEDGGWRDECERLEGGRIRRVSSIAAGAGFFSFCLFLLHHRQTCYLILNIHTFEEFSLV